MANGERPGQTAKYDPNRDENGHFRKGHSVSKGWNTQVQKQLNNLRTAWYDCQKPEDMEQVKEELLGLIRSCPVPDVKLKAIVYYCDRMLGKPTERVEMDVQGEGSGNVNFNLSADNIAVLNQAAKILAGDDAKPFELPPATKIIAEKTPELEPEGLERQEP